MLTSVIAAVLLLFGALLAAPGTQPATRPSADYPLELCPITDEALNERGGPRAETIDGRTVKVCCAGCMRAFKKDPSKWHAKMDEMIVEQGKETYPLDYCLVSGEKLGEIGEPINHVDRKTNRLVRLCCDGCVKAFEKDREKHLPKLDEAQAKN